MGTVPLDPPAATLATSFDDFYETECRRLGRLAYALTGTRAAAEDLVQETMLRAYRHWGRISTYDKPGAWARRVLCNLATSRGRKVARETRALVRLGGRRRDVIDIASDDEHVWRAVRALPRREAHVIALFYLEDMTIADIASLLDAPEGTIKSLLHRGRKTLAAALGEKEDA